MAEVKWIKLKVDMFDDEKIKIIQSMPEGDSLLIIWIRLVTLAGKTNDGGYIYIADNMPYTDEMLSVIFNKPLNTVRLALDTFLKLGMIDNDVKGIYLLNFEKHQSLDKLAEIREQTRQRVARHREKKKQVYIEAPNNDVTLPVTQCNATDIDKDKDKDTDIDKDIDKNKKIYFENENINSIFTEFIEVRKKLKAVNSDRAINTLINKLNKYPDDIKYQMIENSIVNSWKDVYELKQTRSNYNNSSRKEVVPDWLNKEIKKEPISQEEKEELDELLGEFKEGDDWKEEAKKLQQQLSEAYEK